MPQPDLPAWLFGLGFALVASVWTNWWLKQQHNRAAAHDHIVETSRDVAVPDHCVSCGIAHPTESILVRPRFVAVQPMAHLFDPRLKRWFEFRFCRTCAGPVLLRRRRGKTMFWIGWGLLAVVAAILALASTGIFREHIEIAWSLEPLVFGWAVLVGWGQWLDSFAASPIVSILDSGRDTVLYGFRNQVFRNHFAELNGEK